LAKRKLMRARSLFFGQAEPLVSNDCPSIIVIAPYTINTIDPRHRPLAVVMKRIENDRRPPGVQGLNKDASRMGYSGPGCTA
jgi:hypothetical protein